MTVGAGAPPGSNTSLLIDMNLSPRWIPLLVAAGFAAEHWSNMGPVDAADPYLMAIARERGMVVLTHDLDFRVTWPPERWWASTPTAPACACCPCNPDEGGGNVDRSNRGRGTVVPDVGDPPPA